MESTTALWSGDTLFRAIFKNASVGIAITDPDGHILQINEVSCRFLGYDPHELVGKHFSEITHPDDVLLDRTLYAALVTGERDRYVIDKRFLRKDGIVVWGRITVSLLQHPDSGERYTIVLCQDIHDRKQAEAEQRRSEAKLRKTQQVAHVGNWEFDPATQEITCSEEILRFCGLDPSQSTLSYETVVRSFLHPDDQAAASQLVERAAMEGMSAVDMRIISPDGSLRYVESRAEAVTDDQGQIIRLVGMARDITQRKELELLLRSQVQKEQGINRVVKTIRNSLDLTTVFLTTTREIGQLSEAERVEIVQ